ncbi:MAG: helix-turn-helix transcriptional regulator [Patulibacter sp.]|nr:helix-turn-helix transcriptional regulator [Patulibacter sp.]
MPQPIPIRSGRDLGRAITLLRRQQERSQSDLADAAGIDQSTLSRLERGPSTQADRLIRALRDLGASVVVLPPDAAEPADGDADAP